MKNFTSTTPSFVAVAFCALLGFSLVAFAAKGPCVRRDETTSNHTETTGNTMTNTFTVTDNGSYCAGANEDDCTQYDDGEGIKSITSVHVYEKSADGGWYEVSSSTSYTQGVEKC